MTLWRFLSGVVIERCLSSRVLSFIEATNVKVNEFVKRLRAFKIHILIIGELKKHMPSMFGKKSASSKVLGNLHEHFDQVSRTLRRFGFQTPYVGSP